MSLEQTVDTAIMTAAPKADDAVGVLSLHWYIAIVTNHSENKCASQLASLGYETYVPVQKVTRTGKNGKKNLIDKVLLPAMVFVKASESDRRKHIAFLPFINRKGYISNSDQVQIHVETFVA